MGEITGRKVAVFTVSAFAVIISVNLVMAYSAIKTFPGLEVKNSYVASQTFDAERAAQNNLGWTMASEYDAAAGSLTLRFTDGAGALVPVQGLAVMVGRTTVASNDQTPVFLGDGGVYTAPVSLDPGKWMMKVEAESADGTRFQQRIELMVKG